jgi:chromosome segregation ATPase
VKHQPSRPLSPTTTLLHSLTQANSSLIETKSNLKALRKAHKNTLSELRKEIERHRGLIGNDRGEERAFRRNLALRESIKRAEEESEEMANQLTSLERLPARIKSEWNAKKKTWQVDKKRLQVAQAKAAEEKSNADRQATAVVSESTSLFAKKDKLSARLSKLRVDLGKLDSENADGSDTKEKKLAEREAIERHRESREKEYLTAIQRREIGIRDYALRSHQNWSAYYALETAALQQQQHTPSPADVLSDGGIVVPPGFQDLGATSSYPAANMHHHHINNRERSSSLFSDGSVITNVSELGDHVGFVPAFESVSVAMVGAEQRR